MSIVMEKVCDKCQEKFSSVAAMKCHKKIHEAAAKVFKEVVLEKKEKCIFGDCEHPPEDHEAGLCWHIVDTKLVDVPTTKKFCPCHRSSGLDYGWDLLKQRNPINKDGWMEVLPNDLAITKRCGNCKKLCLINVDVDICHACESNIV